MIVHVWRRAVRGRHRPGRGRDRRRRRSPTAVETAGGRGGDDPRRPRLGLGPHLRGGRGARSRRAGTTSSSTCRATCRPSTRGRSRPRSRRSPTPPSTSPRSPPRSRDEEERTNPNVVKLVGSAGRARPPAGALFHPRHRALRRRAALPPYRPLRLSPRGARALRRAAAVAARDARAAGAAARARGRHAHRRRSSSTTCRSASTRPHDLERARARSSQPETADEPCRRPSIAFQGEPGANSHIACRRRLSRTGAAALPDLRGCLRGGQRRRGRRSP